MINIVQIFNVGKLILRFLQSWMIQQKEGKIKQSQDVLIRILKHDKRV